MNFQAAFSNAPLPSCGGDSDRASDRDREVIRVDYATDAQGIAAALRSAFATAAQEPSSHDFDQLLADLD